MDCDRCKKCIWYEQCQKYEDLDEECEYFDYIDEEEQEYFWTEMSYWRYNRGGR